MIISHKPSHMKITSTSAFVLVNKKGTKYYIDSSQNKEFHTKDGLFNIEEVIGQEFGSKIISNTSKEFFVVPTTFSDKIAKIRRGPQVIHEKDAAQIIFELDISPGKKILEIATGSGYLTCILAHYIRPDGKIYSYEINKQFFDIAYANLKNLDLLDNVELKQQDALEEIGELDMDAVILDFPYPHKILENVREAMKIGAKVAIYSPNAPQVNRVFDKLEELGFLEIKTFDISKTQYKVSRGVFRPKGKQLGHTAYITIAQRCY